MQILSKILESLTDAEVLEVRVGLNWTGVVVQLDGATHCGLASTISGGHNHDREPDIPDAGRLETLPARELAWQALSSKPTLASVGMAAINALLPFDSAAWNEENAEDLLARRGQNARVVMVGRFPFAERLRSQVGELLVLEQNPGPGDLPAEQAPAVLPTAEVVAITGMTFTNHTLEPLLALCQPEAYVIVMGASTPLSPVLFEFGVDVISGAVVTAIDPVLHTLSQGGNFHQIHKAGVRLVNYCR